MEINHTELVLELQELVAALDRRVPRVERAGEAEIARDAAALRARALKRLDELTNQSASKEVISHMRTKTPGRRQ